MSWWMNSLPSVGWPPIGSVVPPTAETIDSAPDAAATAPRRPTTPANECKSAARPRRADGLRHH
jgi:hypothetical protein